MRVENKRVVIDGDMSANITSESFPAEHAGIGSVHCIFTGSPVGTIKLQSSNNSSEWTDITGSSRAVSTANDIMYNLNNIGFRFFRVVYTATSGSGTLNVWVNVKGF